MRTFRAQTIKYFIVLCVVVGFAQVTNSGTCENPRTMFFDTESKLCRAFIGQSCYLPKSFTKTEIEYESVSGTRLSSSSADTYFYEVLVPCPRNAECRSTFFKKVCTCHSSYISNDNKTKCVRQSSEIGYGQPCGFDGFNCSSKMGLECKNGVCLCKYLHLQYFNGVKCVSRVGGPCHSYRLYSSPFRLTCTPNSNCVAKGRHDRCECPAGFLTSWDGKCLPGFNQTCSVGSEFNKTLMCADTGLLICVDGTCKCPDDLCTYIESEKRCRGLVGAYCNIERERTSSSDSKFCVENSFCSQTIPSLAVGQCECKKGYMEAFNRTCERDTWTVGWQTGR